MDINHPRGLGSPNGLVCGSVTALTERVWICVFGGGSGWEGIIFFKKNESVLKVRVFKLGFLPEKDTLPAS